MLGAKPASAPLNPARRLPAQLPEAMYPHHVDSAGNLLPAESANAAWARHNAAMFVVPPRSKFFKIVPASLALQCTFPQVQNIRALIQKLQLQHSLPSADLQTVRTASRGVPARDMCTCPARSPQPQRPPQRCRCQSSDTPSSDQVHRQYRARNMNVKQHTPPCMPAPHPPSQLPRSSGTKLRHAACLAGAEHKAGAPAHADAGAPAHALSPAPLPAQPSAPAHLSAPGASQRIMCVRCATSDGIPRAA